MQTTQVPLLLDREDPMLRRVFPAGPLVSLIDKWMTLDDDARADIWYHLDPLERQVLQDAIPSPHVHDPVSFVNERLGEFTWSKQDEILTSLRDNRETIVVACHGVGKSFIAARGVAWFVETKDKPLVVTTAPSGAQVKGILWKELGRAHRAGKLRGRCNLTDWILNGEMVALGRKPSEQEAANVFQGMHSLNTLIVLDEAGGIPAAFWDEMTKLMTNTNSRLLAIGNPDEEGSIFHQKAQADDTNTITIAVEDSPNFTGEPTPPSVAQDLVDQEWVDKQIKDHGAESATVARRVHAKFVVDATDGVIPRSWLFECKRNPLPEVGESVIGIDVGGGGDLTVLRKRRGPVAGPALSFREKDPKKQAHRCAEWIEAVGADVVQIDRIGVGHHLVGHLEDLLPLDITIIGVSVAERSSDPEQWPLVRDEMWWTARTKVQNKEWDLSEVDEDTIEQLAAPKYTTDSKGRIKIEPKKKTIERIGSSPDEADALLLAFWEDTSFGVETTPTADYAQAAAGIPSPLAARNIRGPYG